MGEFYPGPAVSVKEYLESTKHQGLHNMQLLAQGKILKEKIFPRRNQQNGHEN
jgi:hypothetical protein